MRSVLTLVPLLLAAAIPPGSPPPGFPALERLPSGRLDIAVEAMRAGDLDRAWAEGHSVFAGHGAAEADTRRARFLLGVIAASRGQHQQASALMSVLRQTEGHPLQPWAAWFEARADLERGASQTAFDECEAAVQKWPEFRWKDECELLQGQALAAQGRIRDAADRFDTWAENHPEDPRREGLQLSLARSLENLGEHESAARRYRQLYLWHRLPTTGEAAQAGLRRLEASGTELPALNDEDLYARACSLRSAGDRDEAWALYCQVEDRNPASGPGATPLGKRIDQDRRDFLWRSQRYAELAREHAAAWERAQGAEGAPEELYDAVTSFSRAGMWDDAVRLQEKGMELYPNSGRFRGSWERSVLLHSGAADYSAVVSDYERWMEESKAIARDVDHRFLAAYYRYRAGRLDEAKQALDDLLEKPREQEWAARYYRARVLESTGDRAGAKKDREAITAGEPDGWYALLLRSADHRAGRTPPTPRDGRWPGPDRPTPPPVASAAMSVSESLARLRATWWQAGSAPLDPTWSVVTRDGSGHPVVPRDGWSSPSWFSPSQPPPAPTLGPEPGPNADPQTPPPLWSPRAGLDPEVGRALLAGLAEKHGAAWPELAVVAELAACGVSELAGPLLAELHSTWKEVQKQKGLRKKVQRWKAAGESPDPEMQKANVTLSVILTAQDWLNAYAAAGWPAGVQAISGGGARLNKIPRSDPANHPQWSLMFPAAFADPVWRAGWRDDVDPLLMLAIMRQESRYRHDAVSRVGALGLVQVMPATGAKVAAMLGEVDFHPERLLTPAENIRIGSYYLGRLLSRFPGQWPLAVASYNGGPHNVGRWLVEKRGASMEDFIEEIAFPETRDYVKKVATWYLIYVDLYGTGAVVVPEKTGPDNPAVIDF